MSNDFIKIDPYIFEDRYKLYKKLEKICCDRSDCHSLK